MPKETARAAFMRELAQNPKWREVPRTGQVTGIGAHICYTTVTRILTDNAKFTLVWCWIATEWGHP